MASMREIRSVNLEERRRIRERAGRRDIYPKSVKGRLLTQDLMANTLVERLSASVADGSKATVTTTLNAKSKDGRIGILPYFIQVYIGTATSANILPSGGSVATTDYDIYSWNVPEVTSGTDGNNIVRKTTVANNSGGTVTMIFDVQTRYLVSGPGIDTNA